MGGLIAFSVTLGKEIALSVAEKLREKIRPESGDGCRCGGSRSQHGAGSAQEGPGGGDVTVRNELGGADSVVQAGVIYGDITFCCHDPDRGCRTG